LHAPYSHSLSDDEKLYKSAAERALEAERDCIVQFPKWLIANGLADSRTIESVTHDVDMERRRSHRTRVEGRSAAERIVARAPVFRAYRSDVIMSSTLWPNLLVSRAPWLTKSTSHYMRRCAATIACWYSGEDVADCSREANLPEVKGKGGVFKATTRIADRLRFPALLQFADRRSFNRRARDRNGRFRAQNRWLKFSFSIYLACNDADRDELGDVCAGARIINFAAPMVIRVAIGGIFKRRRDLSQPKRRMHFYSYSLGCA
jgi:2-oxoisovalerate dehydrogenase E1 component